MAALLIHIKSRMLLPRDIEAEELSDDPRSELVERLLEYQRFKAVAESFSEPDVIRLHVWSRPPGKAPEAEPATVDMSEVSLFDLGRRVPECARQVSRHDHPAPMELRASAHKVSEKMKELLDELVVRLPIRLQWYSEGRPARRARRDFSRDARARQARRREARCARARPSAKFSCIGPRESSTQQSSPHFDR